MIDNPKNIIDTAVKVLEVVPDVYADIGKPVAGQSGAFLERIPRAINAVLAPVDMWIAKREYSLEKTKKSVK